MKKIVLTLHLVLITFISFSQNVGIGTNTPDSSALLELNSNSKGFLPPRMTTLQRNSINNPAPGLQIYNTTTDCLEIFGRGKWNAIYCIPIDSIIATDIDGHTYPTVQICNQTWTAKNLDVAHYKNGDIIPQVTDPTEWANLTTGAWCWYNNDSTTYGAVYGRLYNWYAVNDPRGLAPAGWHVPSDAEWNKLVKCLDESADTTCSGCWQTYFAGGLLKSINRWTLPNSGASNSTGFDGLPAGSRNIDGSYDLINRYGLWWTSTANNTDSVWHRYLDYGNAAVIRNPSSALFGFSVRCVKDTPITTLNNGLVAYYPFNGNANDESGNGNNGTVNGATLTTDRFGNIEKAYNFTGSTTIPSYIEGDCSNFPIGNRTVSLWFYANDIGVGTAGRALFGYGGQTCGQSWLENIDNYDNGGNIYEVQGHCRNQQVLYNYGSNHPNGSWIHWVITTDNVSGTNFYVNGIKVKNDPTFINQTFVSGKRFIFGAYVSQDGNNYLWDGNCNPYNGKLDDIRIYNRALTQQEITYLAEH